MEVGLSRLLFFSVCGQNEQKIRVRGLTWLFPAPPPPPLHDTSPHLGGKTHHSPLSEPSDRAAGPMLETAQQIEAHMGMF